MEAGAGVARREVDFKGAPSKKLSALPRHSSQALYTHKPQVSGSGARGVKRIAHSAQFWKRNVLQEPPATLEGDGPRKEI